MHRLDQLVIKTYLVNKNVLFIDNINRLIMYYFFQLIFNCYFF